MEKLSIERILFLFYPVGFAYSLVCGYLFTLDLPPAKIGLDLFSFFITKFGFSIILLLACVVFNFFLYEEIQRIKNKRKLTHALASLPSLISIVVLIIFIIKKPVVMIVSIAFLTFPVVEFYLSFISKKEFNVDSVKLVWFLGPMIAVFLHSPYLIYSLPKEKTIMKIGKEFKTVYVLYRENESKFILKCWDEKGISIPQNIKEVKNGEVVSFFNSYPRELYEHLCG